MRSTFSSLIAGITTVAFTSVTATAYVVKEGDVLSRIARTQLFVPVYGENGSLKKLLSLNPQIADPSLIHPGQVIFTLDNESPHLVEVTDKLESPSNENDHLSSAPAMPVIIPAEPVVEKPEVLADFTEGPGYQKPEIQILTKEVDSKPAIVSHPERAPAAPTNAQETTPVYRSEPDLSEAEAMERLIASHSTPEESSAAELLPEPKITSARTPAETSPVAIAKAPIAEPPISEPSEKVQIKSTDFKRGALIALTPNYDIASISSQDKVTSSSSRAATQYKLSLTTSYIQEWTASFQTAIKLYFGIVDFEKPTNSTRVLVDQAKILSGLGLETSKTYLNSVNLKFSFDYNKELFLRAATTRSDTVDAVSVPALGLKLSYDAVDLDPFIMGVSGFYKAYLPTKSDGYDVLFGNQFGAGIYFKQFTSEKDDSQFQTEIGFNQRLQDTSITTQTETNITLGVRFFFPIGRRQGSK